MKAFQICLFHLVIHIRDSLLMAFHAWWQICMVPCPSQSVPSPTQGHLGGFHIWTVMKEVTVDISVHRIHFQLLLVNFSYGKRMCTFGRNCSIVFQEKAKYV